MRGWLNQGLEHQNKSENKHRLKQLEQRRHQKPTRFAMKLRTGEGSKEVCESLARFSWRPAGSQGSCSQRKQQPQGLLVGMAMEASGDWG